MIWNNFLVASMVFFGWLLLDAIGSLMGAPLEGVYYPGASGWLRGVPRDWTQKPAFLAPLYLGVFALLWYGLMQKAGARQGLRVAALITSFVLVPFWVVSLVTADAYDLTLSSWWVRSMAYANLSFFLYGFLGSGKSEDLYF